MKYFEWNEEKNQELISKRGVSFEMCVTYINEGFLVDIVDNHSPREHQKVFIINIEEYIYRVPFVEDEEKIFLKTLYPSRQGTKKYLAE